MQGSLIHEPDTRNSFDDLLEEVARENRTVLLENEAQRIVRSLGIAVPDSVFIRADENLLVAAENAWESLWGSRVVIKVVSPEIIHKTELGGVRIVDKLPAEIFDAIEEMQEKLAPFDVRGFLVSELIEYDASPGGELLVNVRWTPEFGAVVSVGLGGTSAELLGRSLRPGTEMAVFSPGLTRLDRIDSILAGKTFTPLLTGALRKRPPRLEAEALRKLIATLLDLGQRSVPVPIDELEINPLVVGPHGLTALDAFVRLGKPASLPSPRPLEKIHNLLEPRSVAIIGVSSTMNPGRVIVRNLLREGFDPNRIWIVKEGCDAIEGCPCVPSIEALPETVDLMVLAIAAEGVGDAMERIIRERKAESVIVIPGGLGEREGTASREEGIRTTIEGARATSWRGPVVNGANSLGVRSIPGNVDTMFLPHHKVAPAIRPGAGIALVSQSGAFAASLGSRLAPVSPRTIVSIGNQIDLTVGDYLSVLAEDPSLDLLAFYVEGFRPGDGRQWLEAASRARAAGKAVILYRAGRTPEGARATASHTAALAGDAVVTRELARGCGVVVADTLDELEHLIRTFWFLRGRAPAGNRMGAFSNAGFECVAMADNPGPFRFVPFSEETTERIRRLFEQNRLDGIMNLGNPLDVNPMMSDEAFAQTARAVIADPGIDVALIGCVPLTGALQTLPAGEEHDEDLHDEMAVGTMLVRLWKHTKKPWAVVVDAGERYDPFARSLLEAGIPTFRRADQAMRVMAAWAMALKRE